ncbi:MAG: lysophospholipase [Clostridia bacterium]|nr:lysophospholipase [Clostridia bacterium]
MFLKSGDVRLSCILDHPEPDLPLAVILHGITGNKEERHIAGAARALGGAGFGTLRVDMYGHGESGGSFSSHTLRHWLANALDAIDFAKTRSGRIYLCGHSQGGLTALLAGSIREHDLCGLILLSPACSIPEGARTGDLLGMRFSPDRVPERLRLPKGPSIGRDYVVAAREIRVEEAEFSGPVLILHGEEDRTVPITWSERLVRQYGNGRLVRIPGDTHCYDHHLDLVTETVRSWAMEAERRGMRRYPPERQ